METVEKQIIHFGHTLVIGSHIKGTDFLQPLNIFFFRSETHILATIYSIN